MCPSPNLEKSFSNDYADICRHSCPVCGKMVERLKIHMVGNHSHMDNFEDFEYEGKEYAVKNFHKCGVCGKEMVFTRVNVRHHVVQQHQITIQEYNSKYMNMQNVVGSVGKRRSSVVKFPQEAEEYDEKEHKLSNDYRDVCKIKCRICDRGVDKDLFSIHLQKKHVISYREYEPEYGKPIVAKKAFHKCGVCGEIFLFTRVRVSGHVTQKHKMSLKEYGKKYLKMIKCRKTLEVTDDDIDQDVMYSNDYEDECKTVCMICNKTLSYGNLASHAYQCHNIRTSDYIEKYGRVEITRKSYHECAICHKTMLFVRYHIAQHVKGKHDISLHEYNKAHMQFHNVEYSDNHPGERGRKIGTQKAPAWCDGTMYKCPFCMNIYYRYFTFRIHLLRSHEVKDSEERGKVVRENEMMSDTYCCKICKQSMKRDRMDIEAHLKQVHKTTMRVYQANFEDDSDIKDPSEVLEKLVNDGLVASEDYEPKRRKRKDSLNRPNVMVFTSGVAQGDDSGVGDEVSEIKDENDDAGNVEFDMPKKRIRRAPAKLLDDQFETAINSNRDSIKEPVVESVKSSPVKISRKSKPQMTPRKVIVKQVATPVKVRTPIRTPSKSSSKVLNGLKSRTPKKKVNEKFIVGSGSSKGHSPSKSPLIEPKTEPITPKKMLPQNSTFIKNGTASPNKTTAPSEPLLVPKKEIEEEVIYKCPMPDCHWTCTREGMRQGPAVLHLLRIHKIQPIEMRERGIKFEKL